MDKVLVLDNYDSFVYNLVHYIEEFNVGVDVFRNDKISVEEIERYNKILLSPGPGIPEEAGVLLPLIKKYASTKSILGVCLGHQAIGQVFGADLINMKDVIHGKSSNNKVIVEDYLYHEMPNEFEVGRYHSWVLEKESIKYPLKVTALDDNGLVMGIKHEEFDVRGVQYHPESIMTPKGKKIIENWLFAQNRF